MPSGSAMNQRVVPKVLFIPLVFPTRMFDIWTLVQAPMPINIARVGYQNIGAGSSMTVSLHHGPSPNPGNGTEILASLLHSSASITWYTPDGATAIPANDVIWLENEAVVADTEVFTISLELA